MRADETFVVVFTVLGLFIVVVMMILGASSKESEKIRKFAIECEQSGGVYVDNARRVDKLINHSYVCMHKNLFIDLKDH